MGSAGCVAYLFERKGVFLVIPEGKDEDTLMGIALDAGADDMQADGPNFEVTCEPAAFSKVKDALEKAGVKVENAEVAQLPKAPTSADLDAAQKVMRSHDALDDHDDVQNVYTSLKLTDEIVAAMEKG